MKNFVFAAVLLGLFASCQESPKSNHQKITSEEYKARVKAEKKRQAELDLPYRMLSPEEKVGSLAFVTGSDKASNSSVWGSLEKNRPDLALLLADSGVSALDPSYRSVREKLPFMAIWNGTDAPTPEFLRKWPYIKSQTSGRKGIYHSLNFGVKKEILKVIMLDSRFDGENGEQISRDQWSWLAGELKKPAALFVLVSASTLNQGSREKFTEIAGRAKIKNLILLAPGTESKISKWPAAGYSVFEVNPRPQKSAEIVSGDAPLQVTKPADFGLLKFDWQKHMAQLEIKSANDDKVESMEVTF